MPCLILTMPGFSGCLGLDSVCSGSLAYFVVIFTETLGCLLLSEFLAEAYHHFLYLYRVSCEPFFTHLLQLLCPTYSFSFIRSGTCEYILHSYWDTQVFAVYLCINCSCSALGKNSLCLCWDTCMLFFLTSGSQAYYNFTSILGKHYSFISLLGHLFSTPTMGHLYIFISVFLNISDATTILLCQYWASHIHIFTYLLGHKYIFNISTQPDTCPHKL